MTKYEKLIIFDNLANFIYESDCDEGFACTDSPLRINGYCPYTNDDEVGADKCLKCIKAWLLTEDEE